MCVYVCKCSFYSVEHEQRLARYIGVGVKTPHQFNLSGLTKISRPSYFYSQGSVQKRFGNPKLAFFYIDNFQTGF